MHRYFDTMNRAQQIYGKEMEPVWKKWNITRNELDVLLFLANNPGLDRAVDIVTNRGMSKSHVSMSVSSLEEKGLLLRREDASDRRTVRLQLTQEAQQIVTEGREVQYRFFTRLHQGITEDEKEAIQSFARKTRENLKKMETKGSKENR